jgi:hypothetical protein
VAERGRDCSQRGEARVRGGGVRGHAQGGTVRGDRQQLRRHHGRARRWAHQHGVPAAVIQIMPLGRLQFVANYFLDRPGTWAIGTWSIGFKPKESTLMDPKRVKEQGLGLSTRMHTSTSRTSGST